MNPTQQETDVLIVGAGPAGLVMALCLAKCGVTSIVIERQPGINPHPKAHELNTRSLEILASLGVSGAELRQESSPKSDGCRVAFCQTINEEIGAIDLHSDIEDPEKYKRLLASDEPYLNISQTEIERVLHRHANSNPLIDLRLHQQWDSMDSSDDFVDSKISLRADNTSYSIRSRWLIAADGAGSRVRKAAGIAMAGPEKIQDFVNAYFELNLREHVKHPAKLYWITEPSGFGTFIAHHIEKRWVYNIPIYEPWESPEDYTKAVISERIKNALGNHDLDIDIKSMSTWRMTVQIAERWAEGRVFLVGDAAHRFPPTGGLGMNSGIADAHNLAWKLSQVLRGESPRDLLDSYEAERKPVAQRNGNESLENFHRIFDVFTRLGLPPTGPERLARLRASWLVRVLPTSLRASLLNFLNGLARKKIANKLQNSDTRASVQKTILDQIPHFDRIGLDLGYVYSGNAVLRTGEEPSEAEVTRYVPSSKAGSRFPHVWMQPDTEEQSSHELLDYARWTLLTLGETAKHGPLISSALSTDRVQHIAIDALTLGGEGKLALKNAAELHEDGAVLIRPDGHVAMRWDQDQELRPTTDAASLRDQYENTLSLLGIYAAPTATQSQAMGTT